MKNTIFTPQTLWADFDDSLSLDARIVANHSLKNCEIQYFCFNGREVDGERVSICAAFARPENLDIRDFILVLPDSQQTIDELLIAYLVDQGYCVLMVDYRGVSDVDLYTQYPDSISYANKQKAGESYLQCLQSAKETCWYEWTAVARYAYRFIKEKFGAENIALLGIKDGGEIAWKLASQVVFSCFISVNAVGWLAYRNDPKFAYTIPEMSDERYQFLSCIDSQAYAQFVKCPVLLLNATSSKFDYDRAFDTYCRINEEYIDNSSICYSVYNQGYIGQECLQNALMFLNKYVKNRSVYIPKPLEIKTSETENNRLVADIFTDIDGEVEDVELFFAEDIVETNIREWYKIDKNNELSTHTYRFEISHCDQVKKLFLLACVRYTNGFTAWSKVCSVDLQKKYQNSIPKTKIIYNSSDPSCPFYVNSHYIKPVADVFIVDETLPIQTVEQDGVLGLYSPMGLVTRCMATERYQANDNSVLSFDWFAKEQDKVIVLVQDLLNQELYSFTFLSNPLVWQTIILEANQLKNNKGEPLSSFNKKLKMVIDCKSEYAINNMIWL